MTKALFHRIRRLKLLLQVFLAAATLAASTVVLAGGMLLPGQSKAPEAALVNPARTDQTVLATQQQARTDLYGDPLPTGALARMGTLRWRHVREITDITFSRDGRIVASSSWQDGSIRFWEMNTGREHLRIDTGEYGTAALALSPDGNILASAAASRHAERPQDAFFGR